MTAQSASRRLRPGAALCLAALVLALAGCARNAGNPVAENRSPAAQNGLFSTTDGGGGDRTVVRQDGATPPAGVVTASFTGASLRLWPFTGNSFDGAGVDPISLVFVGKASPEQIRDALLSLDGNRTALGFPDAYPFNQRWKDASGDVQTAYAEPAGWTGSQIQLELGDYGPVRFHLRLFPTSATADGGVVTLGAVHFEINVPGTTEHFPLSWERAREIVAADLMRSGLLDEGNPAEPTNVFGATPSWRDIPVFIYNELPPDLIAYIGGPPPPVSAPVPMPNDGTALVLHLTGSAASAGTRSDQFTVQMHQVVPKPFCSAGPYDYVLVDGPVAFYVQTGIDSDGQTFTAGRASGTLSVTPVDVTQDPPVPAGPTWTATISDQFNGTVMGQEGRVQFQSKRILPETQGTEMVMSRLMVASRGQNSYSLREKCLGEELVP